MSRVRLLAVFGVLILLSASLVHAQTCRTPGGNRAVVFEPAVWHIGDHSPAFRTAAQNQHYVVSSYFQNTLGTVPTVTLTAFINEMQTSTIGLFFLHTHANPSLFGLEFYEDTTAGQTASQAAYDHYIDDLGYDSAHITLIHDSHIGCYLIAVTAAGIQNWCTNLDETLVYSKGCNTSGFNGSWNALVALGYDATISGLAGADRFFERMDGTRDRGPGNTRRSVDNARAGIDHLVATGNQNIVISPVVIDHSPPSYGLVEEGQVGYVEFDCQMDQTVPPTQVVTITGTIGSLSDVQWINDHRIGFRVNNIEEFASIDFKIDETQAVSQHNGAQLDGNNNPNETDGVGPNGDFYNWTSLTSYFSMMDFEDGLDGAPIQSSIPGMQFITTQGYDWIYGDKSTGTYNIYPYGSGYYWCDGNFFAWLGPNQGNGRINFTGATATSVSFGASAYSGIYLEAYDSGGALLGSDFAPGNCQTNTLSQVRVAASGIDHVIVHDAGNYWLIDNLVVVDLLQQTLILLPDDFAALLEELHTIVPGIVESFLVWIDDIADNIQVIINWLGGGKDRGVEFTLRLYRPGGELFSEIQSAQNPITVDIPDPDEGQWTIEVLATETTRADVPYCLVVAAENQPMCDVLTEDTEIHFSEEFAFPDAVLGISAVVSCDPQSLPLQYVTARCFLGDPGSGGQQVDSDEYALDLAPGSPDTVYFSCAGGLIGTGNNTFYIVLDPDEEVSEYNETNNLASAEIPVPYIYPGDTDNSGVVDADDILPIVCYWRQVGPSRPGATHDWTRQDFVAGWVERYAQFADCNGDGEVDIADVLAIGLNWQQTRSTDVYPYPLPANLLEYRANALEVYRSLGNSELDLVLKATIAGAFDLPHVDGILANKLLNNYPNPFNPATRISFSLKDDCHVALSVYNLRGQLVRTLTNGPWGVGNHFVTWNGRDDRGAAVSSGPYFYQLKVNGNLVETKKMMLLK